jgi:hypothetical protein
MAGEKWIVALVDASSSRAVAGLAEIPVQTETPNPFHWFYLT